MFVTKINCTVPTAKYHLKIVSVNGRKILARRLEANCQTNMLCFDDQHAYVQISGVPAGQLNKSAEKAESNVDKTRVAQ